MSTHIFQMGFVLKVKRCLENVCVAFSHPDHGSWNELRKKVTFFKSRED